MESVRPCSLKSQASGSQLLLLASLEVQGTSITTPIITALVSPPKSSKVLSRLIIGVLSTLYEPPKSSKVLSRLIIGVLSTLMNLHKYPSCK